MKKIIDFFNKHKNKVNKYQLTLVIFLLITFFVGDYNLLDGIRYKTKIDSLQKDIASLKKENEKKILQIEAIQGDKESLERFAREQFNMSKAGEELFLIED